MDPFNPYVIKIVQCLEVLFLKPCCVLSDLSCICSVYFSANFYQVPKSYEFIAERELTFMKIPSWHFGGAGDHMYTPYILTVPDTNVSF